MQLKEYSTDTEAKLEIYGRQFQQLEDAYVNTDPVSWRKHPLSPLTPLFLSYSTASYGLKPLVLDIGCGACEKTRMLSRFSLEMIGVDYSEQALASAQVLVRKETADPVINLVRGDMLNLSFRDGVFDGAHDYLSFLHVMREDWDKYINSVYRVLRPKATLLIVTFSGHDPDFYGYPINTLQKRGIVFSDQFYQGDKSRVSHLINSYFYFPREEELIGAFKERFEFVAMEEFPHPLQDISEDHRNRKLWHVLLRRSK